MVGGQVGGERVIGWGCIGGWMGNSVCVERDSVSYCGLILCK